MSHVAHSFDDFNVLPTPHDRRPSRKNERFAVAVIGSLAVHAAFGVYLWKAKFEPHYRIYEEEVTDVTLVKPRPPPPLEVKKPPPPPPPAAKRPPPVQPRPPVHTATIAEIPPLPIPPVVQRVTPATPPAASAPPKPAPPKPAPPSVITQPDWRRLPSADDIARYYPERAQRMGIEGRAVISCSVTTGGTLRECSVTTETPADASFGDAALHMSRLFQMKPMTKDGQPVADARVAIPIRFVLPK